LDPLNGMKRLFSQRSFLNLIKSVFKIGILAYIVHSLIMKELPAILSLAQQDAASIVGFIARACFSMAVKLGAVFIFLAGLDYLVQRWQQKKGLMMTRQEIKEEFKEREGSPLVKSRIRSLQRELARRRM